MAQKEQIEELKTVEDMVVAMKLGSDSGRREKTSGPLIGKFRIMYPRYRYDPSPLGPGDANLAAHFQVPYRYRDPATNFRRPVYVRRMME